MRRRIPLSFVFAVALLACNRARLTTQAAPPGKQSGSQESHPLSGTNKYFGPIATITALQPIKLFHDEQWASGYVSAEGTWVTVSPKREVDVNSAIVRCFKDENECIESTAFVFNGMLASELNVLKVERWDDHEIVTKPDDAICARNVLRISHEQKRITEVQSVFKTDGPCNMLTLGDTIRELQVGNDIAIELRSRQ